LGNNLTYTEFDGINALRDEKVLSWCSSMLLRWKISFNGKCIKRVKYRLITSGKLGT
jgi:hypothetical protein